jgi:hypothetical protein
MCSHARLLVRPLFCLGFIVGLMAALSSYGGLLDNAEEGTYEKCPTLAEAVKIAQAQLVEDGKPEYAALLTEARVRAAIVAAIRKMDRRIEDKEKSTSGSEEYWKNTIKPICQRIIDTGEWPSQCSFTGFYGLSDNHRIHYDGLGLRLNIKTPQDKFKGYGLPIEDLYFGQGGGD